ncbi:T9SS type A sorting domain-containing protein [Hyunsoonleella sp. SJ7]|uniref:T9SS type A sorting domain-containing protein n=1 Tax=Hyunsoonleella aquatilis TaxID=2762758 RepID=A0A923HG36_9FLAO|nr:T9SS type A sorting domain-containing protein [Hyunsoonleella aquatilis]MBC3758745.1 T9SS type A sorting domain-containing protein [Hyunsoonleella aquatilis]
MILSAPKLQNIVLGVLRYCINSLQTTWVFPVVLLCCTPLFSQDLYVDDNSYMYARDVVLFVNDDIRLETATSNLYLRGDAQLLQNTDSKNSDAGELSIYQNQTTGVFEYNYWCSPVGVSVNGTVQANEDFDGSNIHDPADHTDLTNVTSPAYTFTPAYNGTTTALSNYWMYTLRDGEGYYSWNQIFDTGAVGTGYGFTLKGSPNADNVLDLRGRPNNGTITVSCAFDGTDDQPGSGTLNTAETLAGNPYPSALDLKLFFANSAGNQTNLSGEIFFWEQKNINSHFLRDYEGGYSIYTPGPLGDLSDNGTYATAPFENYNGDGSDNTTTTGNTADFSGNNSRRYAGIGQGFIIQSSGAGGNATFDNSMRVYYPEDSTTGGDGSIFAKHGNVKGQNKVEKKRVIPMSHNGVDYKSIFENPTIVPEIRIHTHINDTYYKENVIALRESTPSNNTYNKFFDGKNINDLASDAYLVSGEEPLVIKSIKYNESVRIPFVLKTDKDRTAFEVKTFKLRNTPNDLHVYIYDKLENIYTDIQHNAFNITLNEGVHEGRFEITFSTEQQSLGVEDLSSEDFKIFENRRRSQIEIYNPQKVEITSIALYDVTGKLVSSKKVSSSKRKQSIKTRSLSPGIYIVSLKLVDYNKLNKKVVISGN